MPTIAPSRAHARAIARPIPVAAPVITIRRSASIVAIPPEAVLPIADHDRGVLAAESIRSRQHVSLWVFARDERHVIEVALGVGGGEVDGGVDHVAFHAGDRGDGLGGAGGGDEVANHGFGRADW